ncbi:apolipoprotein N-acyltransferase [Kushneria phyllosphaerae]|uniref:Apolipoprotein N-acyltransferase n=1 Tax=Kushneria phyllosphaerae TaxID=2100822 RepID=A0A2R8CQL2_9GAMM|nr:apolipoprotein N-acyltransferase [Kushneria phyllosphaerae]SPJ35180.1 Apolipoprotein N-acyltransferase [Kushneria phyllosphaerae]
MASLLQRRGVSSLLALLAGALTTLTFAPFDLWGLGPVALAVFYIVLQHINMRQTLWRGWLFGVGMFGSGASWVYVSIHDYGNTGGPLAIVLTGLFIVTMALFVMLPALLHRLCAASKLDIVAFAGAWALGEAFRSWAFTGFPWLFLGSAHVSSPLASLAPLGGVYLVSLVVSLSGALLARTLISRHWWLLAPLAVLWLIPLALPTQWARPVGDDVTVSLVQGDLAQLSKWTPDGQRDAVNTYFSLTRQQALDSDLVIWPETALPMLEQQAMPFLQRVQSTLPADSTLMTGIMQRDQNGMFYNSMIALGDTPGQYRKAHLVPFGEYLPLEPLLGGLLKIFNIPMGNIGAGSHDQPPLQAHGLRLGVAICYEIVYPDLVRQRAKNANALVTISNDTWFGHSIGPLQHMQMAQLRALENNRYLLRATNNGMTAIVAPDGRLQAQAPRFEPAVLNGTIRPMEGLTPFTKTGSWPALLLALLMLLCGGILRTHRRDQTAH